MRDGGSTQGGHGATAVQASRQAATEQPPYMCPLCLNAIFYLLSSTFYLWFDGSMVRWFYDRYRTTTIFCPRGHPDLGDGLRPSGACGRAERLRHPGQLRAAA